MEIHFSSDADKLMGVHNNKQSIEFTYTPREECLIFDEALSFAEAKQALWEQLTEHIKHNVAQLSQKVKAVADELKLAEASSTSSGLIIPCGADRTNVLINEIDPPAKGCLSEEEKEDLRTTLTQGYPRLSKEEIEGAIKSIDENKSRAIILYIPLKDSKVMFSTNRKSDQRVIEINVNHPLYTEVIKPLKDSDEGEGALVAVELWLTSWALTEAKYISNEAKYKFLELIRSEVSHHLANYFVDFND
jgi:hypothetical protein